MLRLVETGRMVNTKKMLREAADLKKQHVALMLEERAKPASPGTADLSCEVTFCQSIIRHPDYMKVDLVQGIEPEFMRSPATRRLWEGMLFSDSLGDGCGVAALHKNDWVAFLLSEWLVDRWTTERIEALAIRILGSGLEMGLFDEVLPEFVARMKNGPPQE